MGKGKCTKMAVKGDNGPQYLLANSKSAYGYSGRVCK